MIYTRVIRLGMALVLAIVGGSGSRVQADLSPGLGRLNAIWSPSPSHRRDLLSWSPQELARFRRSSAREKDPQTGKWLKVEQVPLSQLLDKALEVLPIEGRAQVDLIILKGNQGQRALIPRAFITKYPNLLALQWNADSHSEGKTLIYSVVPSHSKKVKLPVEEPSPETFSIQSLDTLELTNTRELYSSFYLKRRTDPIAMRGEKLFMRNCVGCHSEKEPGSNGFAEASRVERFTHQGHPTVKGGFRLSDRDRQSILQYINAHREENSATAKKSLQSLRGLSSTE